MRACGESMLRSDAVSPSSTACVLLVECGRSRGALARYAAPLAASPSLRRLLAAGRPRVVDDLAVFCARRIPIAALGTALRMLHRRNVTGAQSMQRVARYSRLIGEVLAGRGKAGADDEFVDKLFAFASMRDLGMIAVPDRILSKRGAAHGAGRVRHEEARPRGGTSPRGDGWQRLSPRTARPGHPALRAHRGGGRGVRRSDQRAALAGCVLNRRRAGRGAAPGRQHARSGLRGRPGCQGRRGAIVQERCPEPPATLRK